eukprot:664167-Prymnesium_polylepis.1
MLENNATNASMSNVSCTNDVSSMAREQQALAETFRRVISLVGNTLADSMESDSKPVLLRSEELNITVERRSPEMLTQAPFECKTSTTPVLVELPSGLANATNSSGKSIGA